MFGIKQVKKILPKTSLRTLYFSMIHSYLSYSILAWGNANQSNLKHIITLQKRALRLIHNTAYNSHTEPLFKKSQILKLGDLYEYEVVKFMSMYLKKQLPRSFDKLFMQNHEIQENHNTRQRNLIHIERCDSEFARRLPLYTFPYIWNRWSNKLLDTPSNQMLKKCKSSMFTSYADTIKCDNLYCSVIKNNKK